MVRPVTETEAHMPDYGSGSFLLGHSQIHGSHAEWVATPQFEDKDALGQSVTFTYTVSVPPSATGISVVSGEVFYKPPPSLECRRP